MITLIIKEHFRLRVNILSLFRISKGLLILKSLEVSYQSEM